MSMRPVVVIIVFLLGFTPGIGLEVGSRFLLLDIGAREIGMGGIATSGVNSMFYNPALLATVDNLEFGLMHAEWLGGVRYETFGVSRPIIGFGAFGVGATLLHMSDLQYAEDSIRTSTTFGSYDFCLQAALCRKIGKRLATGLTLKAISRTVYDRSCLGVGADLGLTYQATNWLRLMLAAQHLGPPTGFEERTSWLPIALRVGLGGSAANNSVRWGLEVVNVIDEPNPEIRLGIEYEIAKVLGVRTGYRDGYRNSGGLSGFNTGLGVRFREFAIDYAFTPYGDLGNTHRVSLIYTRGLEREKEETLVRMMLDELKKKEKMMGASFYKQGLDYLARKEYDEAVDAFDKALTWDPELTEAQAKMDEARQLKTDKQVNEHSSRGLVYYNSGDMVNAYYEFSQAVNLAPTNQELINWRNRVSAALVKKEPDATGQRFQSGINYYGRGEYRKAIEEWKAVLAASPNHGESQEYILRAQVKLSEAVTKHLMDAQNSFDRKEWDQALTSANRVLNLEPTNTIAADLKRKILDNLKRELTQTLQKAVSFYNQKDLSSAEESFRLVLSWDPKNRTALDYLQRLKPRRRYDKKYLADLYLKGINAYTNNDFKSALSYWNKIAEIDPSYENIARNIDRAKKRLAEYK